MALELVKYEADWCGPCQQQSTILEDFDAVPVRVIDVDENQQAAIDAGVQSIPTMILQEDGEELERVTGVHQLDELEELVERHE